MLYQSLEFYTCTSFQSFVITLKQGKSITMVTVTSMWLLQTNFNLSMILSFCSEVID